MNGRILEIQSVQQTAKNKILLTLNHPVDELDLLFYAAIMGAPEKFLKKLSATFTIYNKEGKVLMEKVQSLSMDIAEFHISLNQACLKPDIYFISLSFGTEDNFYISKRLRYEFHLKAPYSENSFSNTIANLQSDTIVDLRLPLYRYENMQHDLKTLSLQYPEFLTLEELGSSLDGRTIYMATLGNPAAPNRILIQAAMHAREWKNTHLLMALLEYYCRSLNSGIYKNVPVKDLLEQVCFYFIPMANPDGVALVQEGLKAIRSSELKKSIQNAGGNKNLTFWKANARGVNLNNNFSAGWKNSKGTHTADSERYKGPHPFSEPEAVILKNLVESKKPTSVVSYHEVGNVIYWMYGQQGELLEKCTVLTDIITQTTGYVKLSGNACSGGFSDWCVCEKKIPACTVETGCLSAPVSHMQFQKMFEENKNIPAELGLLY